MFCKYCGKELQEGESCGCERAKAERESRQSQQAPQGQPGPVSTGQIVQSNGCATAGFVCALLGFLLSLVPFVGTVLGIIGLVLSIVGLAQAGSRNGAGRGLAIAGLVISLLPLIVLFAVGGSCLTCAAML